MPGSVKMRSCSRVTPGDGVVGSLARWSNDQAQGDVPAFVPRGLHLTKRRDGLFLPQTSRALSPPPLDCEAVGPFEEDSNREK